MDTLWISGQEICTYLFINWEHLILEETFKNQTRQKSNSDISLKLKSTSRQCITSRLRYIETLCFCSLAWAAAVFGWFVAGQLSDYDSFAQVKLKRVISKACVGGLRQDSLIIESFTPEFSVSSDTVAAPTVSTATSNDDCLVITFKKSALEIAWAISGIIKEIVHFARAVHMENTWHM